MFAYTHISPKLFSESGRDISEKIALGLAKPSLSKESMYDARLFNQSEGIGSGFKDDDGKKLYWLYLYYLLIILLKKKAYNTYDKPLFNQSGSSIYRFRGDNNESEVLGSTNAEDLERSIKQDKFGVRKGFQGTEGGESSSGPVEFEKETLGQPKKVDKDVFGLDTFLNKAKKGKRAREDDDSDDEKRKR